MATYCHRLLINLASRRMNCIFLNQFISVQNSVNKNPLLRISLTQCSSSKLLSSSIKRNVKPIRRIVEEGKKTDEWDELSKMSLFQRYKIMLKKYWYVAIPVHAITSALWFGAFYIAAKCGVDAKKVLEKLDPILSKIPLPETIKNILHGPNQDSKLGYVAIALVMYKIATPARYAATVAGTGYAIKFFVRRGMIKPVPSKDKIKQAIKDSNLKQVIQERMKKRELVKKQTFNKSKKKMY